jgi:nucleoside-diphosphate-sugar epimerase
MSKSLVLITGATGHLGFRTLLDLLQDGYKVRAAVRSEAKKQVILSNPAYKALQAPSESLSFVIVPDLQSEGAYDEAVQGVDYVIHHASPITTGGTFTTEEYHNFFIKPAVHGTIGMLESAAKSPNVKRIVVTSSIVAVIPFGDFINGLKEGRVVKAEDRAPNDEGPYALEFQAYSASKIAALNAAEEWMTEEKPTFDLIHIHPSFIEGRNELALTAEATIEGTNQVVLNPVLGKTAPYPAPATTVHNDDVARLHVDALKPEIPAGSYLATSNNPAGTLNGSSWEKINEIVARKFPDAVKKGLVPNDGHQASTPIRADASKTEKVFGIKFKDFESQVESVVGHYLELLK